MHIVSAWFLVNFDSGNGVSHIHHQAMTWIKGDLLSIGLPNINVSDIFYDSNFCIADTVSKMTVERLSVPPHKGPVTRSLGVHFYVNLNKLLHKWSSYWWLETPWRSCEVNVLDISKETNGLWISLQFSNIDPLMVATRYELHISKYFYHDDIIKWNHFPRYWPFVRGIHRWPVNSPHKGPVTQSFDVFFDLCMNKRLNKQSWSWWFETPSRQLWRHCNDICQWPMIDQID